MPVGPGRPRLRVCPETLFYRRGAEDAEGHRAKEARNPSAFLSKISAPLRFNPTSGPSSERASKKWGFACLFLFLFLLIFLCWRKIKRKRKRIAGIDFLDTLSGAKPAFSRMKYFAPAFSIGVFKRTATVSVPSPNCGSTLQQLRLLPARLLLRLLEIHRRVIRVLGPLLARLF